MSGALTKPPLFRQREMRVTAMSKREQTGGKKLPIKPDGVSIDHKRDSSEVSAYRDKARREAAAQEEARKQQEAREQVLSAVGCAMSVLSG
jgi:hypothetical protein